MNLSPLRQPYQTLHPCKLSKCGSISYQDDEYSQSVQSIATLVMSYDSWWTYDLQQQNFSKVETSDSPVSIMACSG